MTVLQVFFLTLVRPAESPPDWSRVKAEYDKRYGFPAPEMSAALFDMFSEVHKSLRWIFENRSKGWPPKPFELSHQLAKKKSALNFEGWKSPTEHLGRKPR